MRRYGIEKPYEKLKDLTRDQEVNQQTLREFIQTLELPATVRAGIGRIDTVYLYR